MADERQKMMPGRGTLIPADLDWESLEKDDGDKLDTHYRHILVELGKRPGMLGTIFRKAQNKIQDPAKLKRLVTDLIGREQWTTLGVDVKGDAYEGLLEKNAADVKGGAGQYFTPRPLIQVRNSRSTIQFRRNGRISAGGPRLHQRATTSSTKTRSASSRSRRSPAPRLSMELPVCAP